MNGAGAKKGMWLAWVTQWISQQKPEQGHPERKFPLSHAPPCVSTCFYPTSPSPPPPSPGFCSSFQDPLTQGYCHMELDKTQDAVFSSESGCLIWGSVSLWYPILVPGQRFQPLVGLMITKASRLLEKYLFYLALSCRSWCLCRWGCAHSTVFCIPTSFNASHSWVKTLSLVSGFPLFHPWRAWRLSGC